MEQTYLPNLNVKGYAGFCLKYIDDAGDAPKRTATADYSWQIEKDAGRIRNETIPENVWLVGWLKFTSGTYQSYGHVFFIKRTGNSYEIHDSEVHSGARKPYKSLDELLGWFAAYKPKYTGWSTNCDGREYAKIKEDDMKIKDRDQARALYVAVLHRNSEKVSNAEADGLVGRDLFDILNKWIPSPEWQNVNGLLYSLYPEAQKEIEKLKKELAQSGKNEASEKLKKIREGLGLE